MRACLRDTISSTRTMSRSLERPTTISLLGTMGNSPPWYFPEMNRSAKPLRGPVGCGADLDTESCIVGVRNGEPMTRKVVTLESVDAAETEGQGNARHGAHNWDRAAG